MPARSVLLNVSITAKGLGKDSVVERVRDLGIERDVKGLDHDDEMEERVDSATSASPPPSFNDITTLANTSFAISTTPRQSSPTTATMACTACGASTEADGILLNRCSGCKAVFYCSRKCQKKDWQLHKRNCDHASNPDRASLYPSSPPSPTATPTPRSNEGCGKSLVATTSKIERVENHGAGLALEDTPMRDW